MFKSLCGGKSDVLYSLLAWKYILVIVTSIISEHLHQDLEYSIDCEGIQRDSKRIGLYI